MVAAYQKTEIAFNAELAKLVLDNEAGRDAVPEPSQRARPAGNNRSVDPPAFPLPRAQEQWISEYREGRPTGDNTQATDLTDQQWARLIRVVPGQSAMSSTFQLVIVVIGNSTIFTQAAYRCLVWASRNRHLTIFLAPPIEAIPHNCRAAWDLFYLIQQMGWTVALGEWEKIAADDFAELL